MKKIICTVCALIMMLTLLSPAVMPAQAAGNFKVTVSSGSAKAGKEITLKVSATKNSGVCTIRLMLEFDAEKLTPTKFANTNSPFVSKGSVTLPQTNAKRFIYNFASASAVTTTGLLMSVTFKVAADVAEGETVSVTVKEVESGDILDGEFNPVTLSVTAGSVKVPVPASSTTSSKPASSSKPAVSSAPAVSSKPAVTSEADTSTEPPVRSEEEVISQAASRPSISSVPAQQSEEDEETEGSFSVLALILGIIVAIETGVIFFLVMILRDRRYRHNRSRRY